MTKPKKWCVQSEDSGQHAQPCSIVSPHGLHEETLGTLAVQGVPAKDWSDWVYAQADLSLHFVHRSFWFIYGALAQIKLSHITRKPVFRLWDQLRLKPADETG